MLQGLFCTAHLCTQKNLIAELEVSVFIMLMEILTGFPQKKKGGIKGHSVPSNIYLMFNRLSQKFFK